MAHFYLRLSQLIIYQIESILVKTCKQSEFIFLLIRGSYLAMFFSIKWAKYHSFYGKNKV